MSLSLSARGIWATPVRGCVALRHLKPHKRAELTDGKSPGPPPVLRRTASCGDEEKESNLATARNRSGSTRRGQALTPSRTGTGRSRSSGARSRPKKSKKDTEAKEKFGFQEEPYLLFPDLFPARNDTLLGREGSPDTTPSPPPPRHRKRGHDVDRTPSPPPPDRPSDRPSECSPSAFNAPRNARMSSFVVPPPATPPPVSPERPDANPTMIRRQSDPRSRSSRPAIAPMLLASIRRRATSSASGIHRRQDSLPPPPPVSDAVSERNTSMTSIALSAPPETPPCSKSPGQGTPKPTVHHESSGSFIFPPPPPPDAEKDAEEDAGEIPPPPAPKTSEATHTTHTPPILELKVLQTRSRTRRPDSEIDESKDINSDPTGDVPSVRIDRRKRSSFIPASHAGTASAALKAARKLHFEAKLREYKGPSGFRSQVRLLRAAPEEAAEKIKQNIRTTERVWRILLKLLKTEVDHSSGVCAVVGTEKISLKSGKGETPAEWVKILDNLTDVAQKRNKFSNFFIVFFRNFLAKTGEILSEIDRALGVFQQRQTLWRAGAMECMNKRMACVTQYEALKAATRLADSHGFSMDMVHIGFTKGTRATDKYVNPKNIRLRAVGAPAKKARHVVAKIQAQLQACVDTFQDYAKQLTVSHAAHARCFGATDTRSLDGVLETLSRAELSRFQFFQDTISEWDAFIEQSHVPTWFESMRNWLWDAHTSAMLTDWVENTHGALSLKKRSVPEPIKWALPCHLTDLKSKRWDDGGASNFVNPVYSAIEMHAADGKREIAAEKGDLVRILTKLGVPDGFWMCEVITGERRYARGLLPVKKLKTERVRDEMALVHVLCIKQGFHLFNAHLNAEYSSENLDFWNAVHQYNSMSQDKHRKIRAADMMNKYIKDSSSAQINISARTGQRIEEGFAAGRYKGLFNEAQAEIYELMRKDSFARFRDSKPFQDFVAKYAGQ